MDPTVLIVIVLSLGTIAVGALYYYIYTLGGWGKRSKVQPQGEEVLEPDPQPQVSKPTEISSDSSEEEETPRGPPIATAAQGRMDAQAADAAAAAAEAARLARLVGGRVINGRFVPHKVFVDKDVGIEKKHALVRQRREEEAARQGKGPGPPKAKAKRSKAKSKQEEQDEQERQLAELAALLQDARLGRHLDALDAQYGVICVSNLLRLGESQLEAVGMAPLDRRRLHKALAARGLGLTTADGGGSAVGAPPVGDVAAAGYAKRQKRRDRWIGLGRKVVRAKRGTKKKEKKRGAN